MNKKNITNKIVDTAVTTVQKYGYALFLGVMFLGFAVTKSGEVKAANKVVTVCNQLNDGINNPDNDVVIDPLNFIPTTSPNCPEFHQTLCAVCYESGDFVVDANGILKFDAVVANMDPDNAELLKFIVANATNVGLDGIPTVVPSTGGKTVTLHYRGEQ